MIYRPPDQNMKEFNKSIDTLLSKIADQEKKLLYIMGDFNINLLNNDVHESTGEFVDILSSHSLYASIVKPTRITSKSATLIDNIFTNNLANQTSGILMSDISDHLPIFVSTDVNVYDKNASSVNIEIRDMSKHNVNVLKDKLSKVDWDEVCENDNANVQYNKFMDKFQELFEECIPKKVFKNVMVKTRRQNHLG